MALEDYEVSNVPSKTQKGKSPFILGNVKAKKTLVGFNKVSNVLTKRLRRKPRRRKVNQCVLCDQELEIEKDKRKQRRHTNWNKRQHSKLGITTKVRMLNTQLVKMTSQAQMETNI